MIEGKTMKIESEEGIVKKVSVEDLKLDMNNFRIDRGESNDWKQIMLKLFDEEDIIEMAEDIISSGGLNPHENMLVLKENGMNIVLEGNRRLLAIKCILNPKFVPEKYKASFQAIVTNVKDDLKSKISTVNVVFMESREAAKPYIVAKHSGLSTKQWSLISQWRFVKTEFDKNNKNLNETIWALNMDKSKAIASIKNYNLIEYIRTIGYWDDEGLRNEISKNRLQPTKMTWSLGSKEVSKELGLEYNEHYEVKHSSSLSKEKFDIVLFKFAKAALIENSGDEIDTRKPLDETLNLIKGWKAEYEQQHPLPVSSVTSRSVGIDNVKSGGSVGDNVGKSLSQLILTSPLEANTKKAKKSSDGKYFRKLVCKIQNERLMKLTEEISRLPVKTYPTAAVMLTRALIESSLLYCIESKGLLPQLKKHCQNKCGLDDVINFTIDHATQLFNDKTMANPLRFLQGSGGHRVYMNDVVHGNWVEPTPAAVEAIAGDVRELVRAILNGTV
jgi:hypothetical protein